MKCAKCGAEIKAGCVYCSVCGNEIQVVTDYSILEDDYLKELMQDELSGGREEKKEESAKKAEPEKPKKKKSKKNYLIIGALVAVLVLLVVCGLLLKGNSYDSQMKKAEKAYEKKNYEETIEYAQKALKHNKKSAEAMVLAAKAHLELQQEEDAISLLEDAVKADASNKEAYQLLLDLYVENEDYNAIAKLYEKTEKADIQELFEAYLVLPPAFSEKAGSYEEALDIVLESEEGLDIYYTTDGSDPKEEGTPYESTIPFHEDGTYTLKAVCVNEDGIYSKTVKAEYKIAIAVPDLPTATPDSGTYTQPTQISIEVPDNCTAYYEWNGTPGSNSNRYQGPFDMIEGNNVLSVILVNDNGQTSGIQKYNYIYMP